MRELVGVALSDPAQGHRALRFILEIDVGERLPLCVGNDRRRTRCSLEPSKGRDSGGRRSARGRPRPTFVPPGKVACKVRPQICTERLAGEFALTH